MDTKEKVYTNTEIAEILTNVATAYEIKKKSFFRIVSYQNAAETIITQPKPIQKLWQKDKNLLDQLPGIGPGILEKIDYLFKYNRLHPHIRSAFKNIHPAVFTFTKVNGIGPKNAYKLTRRLQFPTDPLQALDKLIEYAQAGEIRKLPTFGERSEKAILENTMAFLGQTKRMELNDAQKVAQEVIDYMKEEFPDAEFVPLGSLRRKSPTVGDIDIAVKSNETETILNRFVTYPKTIQVIARGPKKASLRILKEIRVDLMVQPPQSFGSLLQHFTGSRQHNIALRRYAQTMGYSLSEYGIKDLKTGELHEFEKEENFYNFLKLCFIKPEDRIGENEIEEAQKCYNKKIKI